MTSKKELKDKAAKLLSLYEGFIGAIYVSPTPLNTDPVTSILGFALLADAFN